MPFKRRIDKTRESPITPRAIEIFDAMRRCNGDRWWQLHSELCDELHTPPYAWPCVEHPGEANPYPADCAAHLSWQPDREAQALWRALDAASREARLAARGNGGVSDQPPPG